METSNITLRPEEDVYIKDKLWYIWACSQTGMIVHSVGSPFPLTNMSIQGNRGLTIHSLGKINEPTWRVLKKCSSSTYYIGFLNIEAEEIEYFKLKAVPGENTSITDKSYHSDKNVISIQVQLVDEHGELASNMPEIQVKKITGRVNKELGDYNFIDHGASRGKITTSPNSTFQVQMLSVGQYSLKISGMFFREDNPVAELKRYAIIKHNEFSI